MPVPVLCVVAFFFLMWIAYLKCEIHRLRSENEKLKRVIKEKVERVATELELSGSRRLPVSKSGTVTERF
jgi:hypothetical protein